MNKFRNLINKYNYELLFGLIFIALGLFSNIFVIQVNQVDWYESLRKPVFVPPHAYYIHIWGLMYFMLGIIFGKLLKSQEDLRLLFMSGIIYSLNLIWMPLFFFYRKIPQAFFDISLLMILTIIFIHLTRSKKVIFYLCIPYIIWVGLSWIINLYILIG